MVLENYRKQLAELTEKQKIIRDLYLRKFALGEAVGPLTGFASIDKPWLKYYKEEYITAELPYMTALEYIKKLNENNLDGLAFDCEDGTIYTYQDFFNMVDNVASSLYQMNLRKSDKIATMLPTFEHESFLLYGVDKAGGAISFLHPELSVSEVVESINDFGINLFFVFDYLLTPEMEQAIYEKTNIENIIVINYMPLVGRNEKTISWNDFLEKGKNVEIPEIKRKPEDLLFIAKTGGSTGKPKSVLLNDNCFNIAVHQYLNSDLAYGMNDRWLRLWPLFSATAAVSNNHLPLCAGMNNIIRQFPRNINDFDKILLQEKPNHLLLIPHLMDVLEQSELLKNEDLSFIKTCGCGGMAISQQFEERVNNFIKSHNMDCILGYGWGCTENSTSAAMRINEETTSVGTVGTPQVDTVVAVFEPVDTLQDATNAPIDVEEKAYDELGELCIKSYTHMMGYYNDDKLKNSVLKTHKDGTVWLHTGDLGSISSNGIVTVQGRMTRSIMVYPMAKLYPSSLEDSLSVVTGVREIAIGSIPDPEHNGFKLPVCFIVPDNNYSESEVLENINEYAAKSLPEYARPKYIYFKESFPRTIGEKVDINKLIADLEPQKKLLKTKNS